MRKANSVSARKAKGRRLTQEVCALLLHVSEAYGFGLTDEDVRPVPSSVAGEDIWLSPKAREAFPFSFECKNQEKVKLWEWWKQCAQNAVKGKPILVIKRNLEQPKVVMDMETFSAFLYLTATKGGKPHQACQ